MNLRLAELLGIGKACDVVVSWRPSDERRVTELLGFTPEGKPYAVLHLFPKFKYKQWRRDGWAELGRWLSSRGLRVILSGGPSDDEKTYVNDIARQLPPETINLAGRLRLPETGFLIRDAKVYVGPDTVLTHMAAALGVPTVALFGPSNPVKWGPWPKGYCGQTSPYVMQGSQRVGNVILIQGEGECVPCREEGCDRNIESFSRCLVEISDDRVIAAVEEALSLAGEHQGRRPGKGVFD
jgi:heptosyltransferase-3